MFSRAQNVNFKFDLALSLAPHEAAIFVQNPLPEKFMHFAAQAGYLKITKFYQLLATVILSALAGVLGILGAAIRSPWVVFISFDTAVAKGNLHSIAVCSLAPVILCDPSFFSSNDYLQPTVKYYVLSQLLDNVVAYVHQEIWLFIITKEKVHF